MHAASAGCWLLAERLLSLSMLAYDRHVACDRHATRVQAKAPERVCLSAARRFLACFVGLPTPLRHPRDPVCGPRRHGPPFNGSQVSHSRSLEEPLPP